MPLIAVVNMLKKTSLIPLITFAVAAVSVSAFGESHQQQSQSPGGRGSQSQSSSDSDSSSDADYAIWKNGGGKVHAKAKVDASAQVDKTSKVGPYVEVGKGAQIRQSILMGDSESAKAKVGKSVVVEGSTIQGAFVLNDRVHVKGSMLQGPIEIKAGVRVTSCTLSATSGKPAVVDADLSDKMAFLPASN